MSHGAARRGQKSSLYTTWVLIRQRCFNTRNPAYKNYGGRGISVCERWNSYENFASDMGPKPHPKLTIDRKDNSKEYSPDNCRWATRHEQRLNTRDNRVISYDGITMSASEWEKYRGWPPSTVSGRIHIGWNEQDAVTRPLRFQKRKVLPVPLSELIVRA